MNLMSNTNRTESSPAASIRKSLAALGFTSREVSVRSDRNSFRITIKTPVLGSKTVKDIAKRFEKIDRCERSGEILGGGNTFVFVDHSDQIKTALATTIKNETAAEIATKGWATWGQYEIQNPTSTSEERFKAYFTGGDCGHSLDRSTCWTLNQAIERVVDHVLETGYTAEEPAPAPVVAAPVVETSAEDATTDTVPTATATETHSMPARCQYCAVELKEENVHFCSDVCVAAALLAEKNNAEPQLPQPEHGSAHYFAALGPAPFAFVGHAYRPGAGVRCAHCEVRISDVCKIQDANGTIHRVACGCIEKSGDGNLTAAINTIVARSIAQREFQAQDENIRSARALLQTRPDLRAELASKPHPQPWRNERGESLLTSVEYRLSCTHRAAAVAAARSVAQVFALLQSSPVVKS